jgi:hypothetical protein
LREGCVRGSVEHRFGGVEVNLAELVLGAPFFWVLFCPQASLTANFLRAHIKICTSQKSWK